MFASPEKLKLTRPHPGVKLVHTLRYHESWIGRIAWSPTGILASPSDDETVRLWNAEKGEHLATLIGHTAAVTSAAYNHTGQLLATAGDDETVKLWDSAGNLIRTIEGINSAVKSVAFCPTEDAIAVGCENLVKIFKLSGRFLRVNGGHTGRIWGIAFDSVRAIQITGGIDGLVKLRDATTGRLIRRLEGHSKYVACVAYSSINSLIASSSEDQTIRLWKLDNGELRKTLSGHNGLVTAVAFSPDGSILASRGGDRDETIRLWSSSTGEQLATIHTPTSTFIPPGLTFHPAKPLLAAVGSDIGTRPDNPDSPYSIRDRAIHVWSIDPTLLFNLSPRQRRTRRSASAKLAHAPSLHASPREPFRLLHLSDLHFTPTTSAEERLEWLLNDIRGSDDLGFKSIDCLVIAGDFTDRGIVAGFGSALEFVEGLMKEFNISREKCIIVPGNHDIVNPLEAYTRRWNTAGLKEGEWKLKDDIILAQNPTEYQLRFKYFSSDLYDKLFSQSYPIQFADQGEVKLFAYDNIQLLGFNSCWQIDEFFPKRSSVLPSALAKTLKLARKLEIEARVAGQIQESKELVKIAVLHHQPPRASGAGADEFLGHLQGADVKIVLHGDIHQHHRDIEFYWLARNIHIIGSGSFGSENRPESTPRLYNILEFSHDLKSVRVYTREQRKPHGPWTGWYEWPDRKEGKGRLPYYDLDLSANSSY